MRPVEGRYSAISLHDSSTKDPCSLATPPPAAASSAGAERATVVQRRVNRRLYGKELDKWSSAEASLLAGLSTSTIDTGQATS
jgi:hypothetical protein